MPMIESVKAKVVLEFEISTTCSYATTLLKVEQIVDPILNYNGDVRDRVYVRGIKVSSISAEPKNG